VVRVSLHFFLIWYFLIELYLVLVVCLAMQYCTYSQLFLGIVDSDDDQESESRSPQHQVANKRLDVAEHGERELIELATVSSLYDAEVGLIGTCSN